MNGNHSPTVLRAFTALTVADATRPLLTYYDDATGERVELSGATLANWVAKTANLLVDGLGLAPGSVAAIRLPAHWQTAGVLLGCWSAGLTVDLDGRADHADVAFVAAGENSVTADETYALALAPMGLGFRGGPPSGTLDYSVEVRAYGDTFTPVAAAGPALTDGTGHETLATAVSSWPPGTRGLVDGDAHPDPRDWLLPALLAGGSLVLCRNLDPARLPDRLTMEQARQDPTDRSGFRGSSES